jgi:hypothetical protein
MFLIALLGMFELLVFPAIFILLFGLVEQVYIRTNISYLWFFFPSLYVYLVIVLYLHGRISDYYDSVSSYLGL